MEVPGNFCFVFVFLLDIPLCMQQKIPTVYGLLGLHLMDVSPAVRKQTWEVKTDFSAEPVQWPCWPPGVRAWALSCLSSAARDPVVALSDITHLLI